MTVLSGVGNVATSGAHCPRSGQMRTVASYPALTSDLPSAVKATALAFCWLSFKDGRRAAGKQPQANRSIP
jgi:hypothetical protein